MEISKKLDKVLVFLFIIIVFISDNAMYLISKDTLKPAGTVHLDDYGLVILVIFSAIIFYRYRKVKIDKYEFKWIALSPIFLASIASIQSNNLYGQSLMMGIRPQRLFIILYLIYFPLKKVFYCNKEFITKVEKIIYYFGAIELVLYTLQYFLVNKIIFLKVPISERFGDNRLNFSTVLIVILPFFLVNNIINKNKVKQNTIYLLVVIFFNLVISKGRLAVFALAISLIFIFVIHKRNIKFKLLFMIFGSIFLILVAINSNLVQSYLSVINTSYISNDEDSKLRSSGKQYYLDETSKSPILGRGYINNLYKNAYKYSGEDKNYYFIDNGVFALYFFYGVFGLIWSAATLILYYKKSIICYKKNNNYIFLGSAIYISILLPNIMYMYWYWGAFYMSILMAMSENYSKDSLIGDPANGIEK